MDEPCVHLFWHDRPYLSDPPDRARNTTTRNRFSEASLEAHNYFCGETRLLAFKPSSPASIATFKLGSRAILGNRTRS